MNMIKKFTIKFCGAATEVTGSMHLLTLGDILILLDAGAYQGSGSQEKNSDKLPFNPQKVKYIFLTHAHLDHVGRLPILCKEGFQGQIIATGSTKEIALRVLEDSLKIQLQERKTPLFSEKDLENVRNQFTTVESETSVWEDVDKKLRVRFLPAEHILGSVSILFEKPVSLLYTGDLGGANSSLHIEPKPPKSCVYLVIESTYGNRTLAKTQQDILEKLNKIIQDTVVEGGRLLIPVFSVDRAEEILYLLRKLNIKEKVYLDTPMGIDILDIYEREKYHLSKISDNFQEMDLKNFEKAFRPKGFESIRSNKNSNNLAASEEPCIVLASSGMLEGGRIINHLLHFLPNENNLILFSGFQADGTLGRKILDGAKEVEIEGEKVIICCKIARLDGLSAHADKDVLLQYIDNFKLLPSKVFIIHGEEASSLNLAKLIQDKFRIRTIVPKPNEIYDLSESKLKKTLITKSLAIEGVDLNFNNIRGKKIALFTGGILDEKGEYKLIKYEEIESLIRETREELSWVADITSKRVNSNSENIPTMDSEFNISEVSKTLLEYFNLRYISKNLVKDLIEAVGIGVAAYKKLIERKVKNDTLILDEFDLDRVGVILKNRSKFSKNLETVLKRSVSINLRDILQVLNEVFYEIK